MRNAVVKSEKNTSLLTLEGPTLTRLLPRDLHFFSGKEALTIKVRVFCYNLPNYTKAVENPLTES